MVVGLDKDELQALKGGEQKTPRIVPGMGKTEETATNVKPLGLSTTAVVRQVSMVILANLSIISTGMALGYPAVTLAQLTDPKEVITLSSSQSTWFASINAIGCPFGGLLSGYLLDKVGRKKTIFAINITAIVAWGLMALTLTSNNEAAFIQIMISRFIIGVATGLASSPVGVYSAEVCHPNLRGRLTLGTSISTAGGILFIYVLGYFIRDNFRLLGGIACGYSVLCALLIIPIPESPSWLLSKGRTDEAEVVLRFFRGLPKTGYCQQNDEFEAELKRLMRSVPAADGQKKPKITTIIRRPEVFKPLLIMISFFAFQQFSGIFVVIVYAVQFSIEAGVKIDPIVCAILIGITRLATTFLVGFILDIWGRRPPAMLSGFGMGACMILLAASTWFPALSIPYLPVACIVIYIFTSTLGLMTLPFSMISEVFPQNVRGAAAGMTICCAYLMSFCSIKMYPSMVDGMGNENVFAFYAAVSFAAVIYVYFFLPETKGKTLQEIEDHFKYGGKNDKSLEVEMKEVFVK